MNKPASPGKQTLQRRLIRIAVLVLVLIGGLQMYGLVSKRPSNLGLTDGRLLACPSSPNCVSSQAATDDPHFVEPFRFRLGGDPSDPGGADISSGSVFESEQAVFANLLQIVDQQRRSTLITKTDDYLHFEIRSFLFGFVDDIELLVDGPNRVIHIRSASRLGYSDMGANRKRVEKIRKIWQGQN